MTAKETLDRIKREFAIRQLEAVRDKIEQDLKGEDIITGYGCIELINEQISKL